MPANVEDDNFAVSRDLDNGHLLLQWGISLGLWKDSSHVESQDAFVDKHVCQSFGIGIVVAVELLRGPVIGSSEEPWTKQCNSCCVTVLVRWKLE